MTPLPPFSPRMPIVDEQSERPYPDASERTAFMKAAFTVLNKQQRMFCHVLYETGCRPTEALNLTANCVDVENKRIRIRSLKKRKTDKHGKPTKALYREIPVDPFFIRELDTVFDIRVRQANSELDKSLLWSYGKTTAWKLIKKAMTEANIHGKRASAKSLRHSYGVMLCTADHPPPLHIIAKMMGHSNTSYTEVYLSVVGNEESKLIMNAKGKSAALYT